jgi:hypothetical protein
MASWWIIKTVMIGFYIHSANPFNNKYLYYQRWFKYISLNESDCLAFITFPFKFLILWLLNFLELLCFPFDFWVVSSCILYLLLNGEISADDFASPRSKNKVISTQKQEERTHISNWNRKQKKKTLICLQSFKHSNFTSCKNYRKNDRKCRKE